jgi:YD repeat-containing protein
MQEEVDYRNASGSLKFVRTYRSDRGTWEHNHLVSGIDYVNVDYKQIPPQACFYGWNGALKKYECFAYMGKGTAYSFGVRRGGRRVIYFGGASGYAASADINDRLTPVLDGAGNRIAWQVSNSANDTMETFSLTGYLQSVTDRNGRSTTYTYSDAATPIEVAPNAGLLLKVQDPFGQSLQFTYDSQGRMASMLDPAGNATTYEYDTKGNIIKVTYPDGKFKSYIYNELANTANIARTNALTGIVDENGNRYATYAYTADPKAASTEHAGAVEKYTLTYPSYAETQVTDPLGAVYKYTYTERLGVLKSLSTRRPGAGGVGTVTASFSYDANANLSLYTDYDGTMTSYTYDLTRNLETQRVEASGTAAARTINTEWHATFRLPLRIAEPLRRTTYTYDASGNVLTKTVQATTDVNGSQGFNATLAGTPRTWTYTYSALGQLLTVKGPRTDVNDTTTYTYDEQGNLSTVTNAAGHLTTLSNYDAHGRAGRVTDPNGLVTDFSFTVRGWLSSSTMGSTTTSYTYDYAGQLTGVTLPGGATLSYTYDAAHRLTAITDNAGNSIVYTLDAMGNRTSEQVKDSSGTLTRQIARVYDPLNRLKQITGAQQ